MNQLERDHARRAMHEYELAKLNQKAPLWQTALLLALAAACTVALTVLTLDILATDSYPIPAGYIGPCEGLPPVYGTDC